MGTPRTRPGGVGPPHRGVCAVARLRIMRPHRRCDPIPGAWGRHYRQSSLLPQSSSAPQKGVISPRTRPQDTVSPICCVSKGQTRAFATYRPCPDWIFGAAAAPYLKSQAARRRQKPRRSPSRARRTPSLRPVLNRFSRSRITGPMGVSSIEMELPYSSDPVSGQN